MLPRLICIILVLVSMKQQTTKTCMNTYLSYDHVKYFLSIGIGWEKLEILSDFDISCYCFTIYDRYCHLNLKVEIHPPGMRDNCVYTVKAKTTKAEAEVRGSSVSRSCMLGPRQLRWVHSSEGVDDLQEYISCTHAYVSIDNMLRWHSFARVRHVHTRLYRSFPIKKYVFCLGWPIFYSKYIV